SAPLRRGRGGSGGKGREQPSEKRGNDRQGEGGLTPAADRAWFSRTHAHLPCGLSVGRNGRRKSFGKCRTRSGLFSGGSENRDGRQGRSAVLRTAAKRRSASARNALGWHKAYPIKPVGAADVHDAQHVLELQLAARLDLDRLLVRKGLLRLLQISVEARQKV